jgi:hypothetical protein
MIIEHGENRGVESVGAMGGANLHRFSPVPQNVAGLRIRSSWLGSRSSLGTVKG